MLTEGESDRKKFELPGSKAHYAPSLTFTITHMRLEINPDFEEKKIECKQHLDIAIVSDTDSVELDASEVDIKSVSLSGKLQFRTVGDKLSVKLSMMVNPIPERSRSGLDVYIGCIASSTFSIPPPSSLIVTVTSRPSSAA